MNTNLKKYLATATVLASAAVLINRAYKNKWVANRSLFKNMWVMLPAVISVAYLVMNKRGSK